jgi:hypothetical protein
VSFASPDEQASLNGTGAPTIHADLTAASSNLAKGLPQRENLGVSFMGDTKGGAFDVAGQIARTWLTEPLNPSGRPNSDVLSPWVNGLDLTRRPRDMWIIDFGWTRAEAASALYQEPFKHVLQHVKPERDANRRSAYRGTSSRDPPWRPRSER